MNVERALLAQLITKLAPARVTVVDTRLIPWASVTFSGARHEFTFLAEGEGALAAAQRLQNSIGCDEFAIAGHLVADVVITNMNADAKGVRLDIEALTVVDE